MKKNLKNIIYPAKEACIEKYLGQVAKKFNQQTVEDLIATIGYGGIMASQVVPKVRELYEKEVKKLKKNKK